MISSGELLKGCDDTVKFLGFGAKFAHHVNNCSYRISGAHVSATHHIDHEVAF
jgi:hypothetical protein